MKNEKQLTWKDVKVGEVGRMADDGDLCFRLTFDNYIWHSEGVISDHWLRAANLHDSVSRRPDLVFTMQPEWLMWKDGVITGFAIPDEVLNPKPELKPACEFNHGEWFAEETLPDRPFLKWNEDWMNEHTVYEHKEWGSPETVFSTCIPFTGEPPFEIVMRGGMPSWGSDDMHKHKIEEIREEADQAYLEGLRAGYKHSQSVRELVGICEEVSVVTINRSDDVFRAFADKTREVKAEIKAADGVDEKVGNETDFVTKVRALLYALRDTQAVEVLRMHSDFHDYAHLFDAFQNLQAKMDAADSAIKESLIAQETNGVATHVEGKDKPVSDKLVGQKEGQ